MPRRISLYSTGFECLWWFAARGKLTAAGFEKCGPASYCFNALARRNYWREFAEELVERRNQLRTRKKVLAATSIAIGSIAVMTTNEPISSGLPLAALYRLPRLVAAAAKTVVVTKIDMIENLCRLGERCLEERGPISWLGIFGSRFEANSCRFLM